MFNEKDSSQTLLLIDRSARKYFSKVDIAEGYLFWGRKKRYYTDSRYLYMAKQLLNGSEIECEEYIGIESIRKYIEENRIKQIYVDFENINVKQYLEIKEICNNVFDGKGYIDRKKSIKTVEELENVKKACEIAQRAYHECIRKVKIGQTEKELCAEIEKAMIGLGAEAPSFETIVAFGRNSAVPHHVTGDTKLEENMPILVDMGCKYKGYCSDLTRMAYKGKPSEKFMACYDAVLKANEKAEREITEEMTSCEADAIAREYLKEKGLDKQFTHSLGHGVGIDIHEFPRISPKTQDIMKNGMVFTIEPGVYYDGEFGIRIEDTVVLYNGNIKRLYNDEKNLIIL